MNALEFANKWYKGAPVSEETERRIRSLATGIDLHFVTKKVHCARLCQHERLNDHGDACLDCGAVWSDGKWG